MEYIEGAPLHRVIPPTGMQLPRLLNFAIQIGEALARAHENGIVHRDLKPQNIMVNQDDEVKVV